MADLPASANLNPRLLLRGPGKPRVVDLPALPALVGRGSHCEVAAPGKTVAREHLKISGSAQHMVVEDVGTPDGTLYNGKPLSGQVTVQDRDMFVCGDVQVQFFLPLPRTSGKLVLEMMDPPVTGKVVDLPASADRTLTVGRTAKNDLSIVHKKTSGEHGVIMRRPTGALVMVDNGSTNGTRINGQDLPPNTPREVGSGDLIQFGQVIGLVRPAEYSPPQRGNARAAASVPMPPDAGAAMESEDDHEDVSFAAPPPVGGNDRPASEPAAPVVSPSMPAGADVTMDPLAGLVSAASPADSERVRMPWEIGASAGAGMSLAGGESGGVPDEIDESSIADASLVATPSKAENSVLDLPPMSEGVSVAASPDRDIAVPEANLLAAARFAHAVGNAVPPVKGPALFALPDSKETEPPPEQPISVKLDGAMLVGRKRGMDLRLPHNEISGLHAMLDPEPGPKGSPGSWVVRNAGALNGVFVNGVRIESQSLRHFDQVSFGPFRYIYVAEGHRYPCPLREFPAEIQRQVRLETEGELRVRRPFMLVAFELCTLMFALTLLAIMLLAFTGVLPSLVETMQMIGRGFSGPAGGGGGA